MEERSHLPPRDGLPDFLPETQTTDALTVSIHHDNSLPKRVRSEPSFGSGTYVIQVPKDQIYRIPPPENALIIENHRINQTRERRSSCSCCSSCRCICVLVTIVIIGIIIGSLVSLTTLFTKHVDPQFSVSHVLVEKQVSNISHSKEQYDNGTQYDITFVANNKNQRSRILYNGEDPDDVSLFFRQKKIAQGIFPNLEQGPKSSRIFKVVLHNWENGDQLIAKEVEKSKNNTKLNKNLSLSLSMNVGIKFKVWGINAGHRMIDVSCSLTVNGLAKNNSVIKQKCLSSHD